VARLAERLESHRAVRRKVTKAVVLPVIIAVAVAAFLYVRHYPQLTPEETIHRYIDIIPEYEKDFRAAISDGLGPGDVKVVGRIFARLDEAKEAIRAFHGVEGTEPLMREHTVAALALEVEIMKAVRIHLSGAAKDVAWVATRYRDELVPENLKDLYSRVLADYKLLRAFGGDRAAGEAKLLLGNLASHYRFSLTLLAHRQEVETLLGGDPRPRNLRRASKILDKLYSLRARLPIARDALDTKQHAAIAALISYVKEQIEQVKRSTRERLDLIYTAYPHESELPILYEYRQELPRLHSTLLALDLEAEAAEIGPVTKSLETRIADYEEIESAEEALGAMYSDMRAFEDRLPDMLADGLQPTDAKKCVAMRRALEEHFVVFRHGEKESFKQAHPNILLMHQLHSRITGELAKRTSMMVQAIMQIRETYSRTKDIDLLRDHRALVREYLGVLKAAKLRNEVSLAKVALADLDKRIDFVKNYEKRSAVLEVKKAEIQSLRLTIDSVFSNGLMKEEVGTIRKVKRSLEKYKKYDPWVEGGIFRERVLLVTYIDGLVEHTLNQGAAKVRYFRQVFFRAHNASKLPEWLAEVETIASLTGALNRNDLKREAEQLKREMEYFSGVRHQLDSWREEFNKLRDEPFDALGRPRRGLQAGDVKRLLNVTELIRKEELRASKDASEPEANEKMLSSVKDELLKLSTEINQAIEERSDEAEERVRMITGSLPEMVSIAELKKVMAELEECYAVLKLKRKGAAVSAKAAVAGAKKRIEEVKRAQDN